MRRSAFESSRRQIRCRCLSAIGLRCTRRSGTAGKSIRSRPHSGICRSAGLDGEKDIADGLRTPFDRASKPIKKAGEKSPGFICAPRVRPDYVSRNPAFNVQLQTCEGADKAGQGWIWLDASNSNDLGAKAVCV